MSLTEITTGAVLAALAKHGQDFLAAATGHKGESVGTMLGDVFHRARQNAEATTGKAYLTLLNIGVSPGPVPLKILQSAVAAASLEDDDTLQDIWANLLANAADPRRINRVLPSFTTILKDLTSWDVKFLDAIVQRAERMAIEERRLKGKPENVELVQQDLSAAAQSAHLGYSVKELLKDKRKREEEQLAFGLCMDTLSRLGLIYKKPQTLSISLTTLCIEFVRVCRKPRKGSPGTHAPIPIKRRALPANSSSRI